MSVQLIITLAIIAAAAIYAAVLLRQKIGSFSTKKQCATDCGCGDSSKKLTS